MPSDSQGGWDWKSAYDACEAAAVLFLRKFGGAMAARAGSAGALLPMLAQDGAAAAQPHAPLCGERGVAAVLHAGLLWRLSRARPRRSPPPTRSSSRRPAPDCSPSSPSLPAPRSPNELAETRAGLLGHLFPDVGVTRFDAAHIDDHLDPGITPTVVLMNPPFSALANVDRRRTDAALRHVSSALARLAEGGRLVAITQASFAPDSPAWREDFMRLQERGTVVFSAAIDGAVYARHGTTIETRLTVIDKRAAADATVFPASPGTAPDAATLLRWVMSTCRQDCPSRTLATGTAAMPPVRVAPAGQAPIGVGLGQGVCPNVGCRWRGHRARL